MSVNTFGRLFRVTTWGESHGPAIGCVVDGCPPGIELGEADIQPWLDRRKPGGSRHVSQRRESDTVRILSGVFEGRTTGTPISLIIDNEDARSKDYANIASAYRPSHADYVYDAKYGLRDWRGGGRSSARETAMRVAAGAIARKVIGAIGIRAHLVEIGGDRATRFAAQHLDGSDLHCADPDAEERWVAMLDKARRAGSSLGAVVEVIASGVPAGWGAPVYGKIDADIASAMMGINAAKGVEIGDGFAAARLTGEENADAMHPGEAGGPPGFASNHAGGTAGGITTGQDLVARVAFKPTSSIRSPVDTIAADGGATSIATTGRHDPCVGIRAVPVVEAMMALVLADQMLHHRGQCG